MTLRNGKQGKHSDVMVQNIGGGGTEDSTLIHQLNERIRRIRIVVPFRHACFWATKCPGSVPLPSAKYKFSWEKDADETHICLCPLA